jgi:ribonuclease-3
MTELSDLEAKLGHRFSDLRLLEQALTHGSVRHEMQTAQQAGQQTGDAPSSLPPAADNERLEFLGDAIVGMIVAELLYRRYPELHEGELTRLRAALVSRRHLGQVGLGLKLGEYLRMGRAEERNGGRRKAVLVANCMEALIGALYLEGGLAAAADFVERTVADPYMDVLRADLREHRAIGDYKTALQELLQARRAGHPEYTTRGESGPDHRKRFLVEVQTSLGQAQGEGSNKKRAEQEAARALHEQLTGARELRSTGELPPSETALAAEAAPEPHWPDLRTTLAADEAGAALPLNYLADQLEDGDRVAALVFGAGSRSGSATGVLAGSNASGSGSRSRKRSGRSSQTAPAKSVL